MTKLFARGYVFCARNRLRAHPLWKALEQDGWQTLEVAGGDMLVHPWLTITEHRDTLSSVVCLGIMIDPIKQWDERRILEETAACLGARGDPSAIFHRTSGRFACFLESGGVRLLYRDASGLLTTYVYQDDDGLTISSHAQLLSEMLHLPRSREADAYQRARKKAGTTIYLPGSASPIEGVQLLPANQRLDLETGASSRIFPSRPYTPLPTAEALTIATDVLRTTASMIGSRYEVAVSLTGGVDSRISAAAFADQRPTFFTYMHLRSNGFGAHLADAIAAKRIANKVRRPHKVIIATSQRSKESLSVWQRNSAFSRSDNMGEIAESVSRSFTPEVVHVKSNVSEVFRGFYQKQGILPGATPLDSILKTFPEGEYSREQFTHFCTRFDFTKAGLRGYDPLDMFYWEHKMAAWQSLQILDFDSCFQTFIPFNNAYLLDTLLRTPLSDRVSDLVSKSLTQRLHPELASMSYAPFERMGSLINHVWRRIGLTVL